MPRFFAVLISLIVALPLRAEPVAPLDRLIDALALDDVLGIMRVEGLDYGNELRDEMFPGRGGADWPAQVDRIYDHDRMTQVMRDGLAQELDTAEMAPVITFFRSDIGQRIVKLEVSARRAMLEDGVEEASTEKLYALRESDDQDRLDMLFEFVSTNELVESNVVGALNANYEFYLGLLDGGAFPFEMTQDQVLTDVWSQESEIRLDTEEWLYSYLLLAYDPLSDDDLGAYIDFSKTDTGQALNRALFASFDVLYRQLSRELGQGAARMIAGEDI